MKEYVVGFMYSKDQTHIALVLKNRPTWQVGSFNGIGGKVEAEDASATAAMVREFAEETGVQTSEEHWQHYCTLEVEEKSCIYFFRTVNDEVFKVRSCTDEKIEIYDLKDLPKNLVEGLLWLIPMGMAPNLLLGPPPCVRIELES